MPGLVLGETSVGPGECVEVCIVGQVGVALTIFTFPRDLLSTSDTALGQD